MKKVLVIQNEELDPPAMVAEWLEEAGLSIDIVHAYSGQEVPATVPSDVVAVIAMGGAMGANDDEAFTWLPEEKSLLRDAVENEVPLFGICLGAQLLAVATGGKVERSPNIEIGVTQIDIDLQSAQGTVFESLAGNQVSAAQWHQDWITALPDHATVIASNEAAPVQAFAVGKDAYGVQFHPEVDAAMFKEWRGVADEAADASGRNIDDAVAEVTQAESELVSTWRPIFEHWAARIQAR